MAFFEEIIHEQVTVGGIQIHVQSENVSMVIPDTYWNISLQNQSLCKILKNKNKECTRFCFCWN